MSAPTGRALTQRPVNYVDEVLRSAFPVGVRESRLVVNVIGYFDESGTHKGSPALAFAGFLGKADEWGAFTVSWQRALDEFGIDMFHMASFENRVGVFKDWTEEIRRERLARLLAIIKHYAVGSVGVVISMAEYNQIFDGPARTRTGGAYGLAATSTFLSVGNLVRPMKGDPLVAYTFERGANGAGQVLKVFQDNMKDEEGTRRTMRLLSLTLADKRSSLPLQAADILAYELHKELPRSGTGKPGERAAPARFPLRALATMAHEWGRMDSTELKRWRELIDLGLEHSTGTWQLDPTNRPSRQSRRRSKHDR